MYYFLTFVQCLRVLSCVHYIEIHTCVVIRSEEKNSSRTKVFKMVFGVMMSFEVDLGGLSIRKQLNGLAVEHEWC